MTQVRSGAGQTHDRALQKPYLTLAEVAARLGRSPRTLREWIVHGCPSNDGPIRLDAIRLGRCWMVRVEWLDAFEERLGVRKEGQNKGAA